MAHALYAGLGLLFVMALGVTAASGAQAAREPSQQPTAEADWRIGAAWLGEDDHLNGTVGGRFAIYPWEGPVSRRLGIHILGDWVELSRVQGSLPGLPGRTQTTTQWFTVDTSLGFDVVRTPRLVLDLRGGGAFDVTMTRFALEGDDYEVDPVTFVHSGDGFVTVCQVVAFRDRCHSQTRFTGAFAVGARFWPRLGAGWFIGANYSGNLLGRRQFVGALGVGRARQ